jgi:hypothetical protein
MFFLEIYDFCKKWSNKNFILRKKVKLDKGIKKDLNFEEKGKILQLISASPHFVREHDFEYINLKEIEDNPIIGKVVFIFRKWKQTILTFPRI